MKVFKRIEFYLILIALICLSVIFFFKSKTVTRFNSFDSNLNTFLIESDSTTPEIFFTDFEENFEALIVLDRKLKTHIEKLKYSKVSDTKFKDELIIFQSQVKEIQKRITFAYDSILYSAIFLLATAIFIIFYKNSEKIKELTNIKLVNETQNKISRDLHDTVIQDLKALKLYLDKNDSESIEMKEYYLNQAYNEARYLMSSINDIDFSDNFIEILRKMLKVFENNHKIKTQFFEATDILQTFELSRKIEIFRIFQESLNNIARHSKATLVTVKIIDSIFEKKQTVKITISDNGIGIKNEDFEKENHYGLKNIKERVELSNGKIEIKNESTENGERNGTTIAMEW